MTEPAPPPSVKLICGMISASPPLFDRAARAMEAMFGSVDLSSEVMDFDFTRYYERQMGSPLQRRLVAFERTVTPDALVDAKLRTNALERELGGELPGGPDRPINLDPGYVTPAKLVLASMKNFSHRIYLARGVYGEVTLMFRGGRWEALEWTFPDFASPRYHPFLTAARDRLRAQVREGTAT